MAVEARKKHMEFHEDGSTSGERAHETANGKNTADGLSQALHEVEAAKCGLDYEVGTLLAPNGVVLREYGGTDHQVNTPLGDRELFKGNVFTHNHPGGRTFSLADIREFVECEASEVRVSTPQGMFFSLRENADEINRSIANVMAEEKVGAYLRAKDIMDQEMAESGVAFVGAEYKNRLFDIMHGEMDRWLAENAEEFGYLYTKGEL
jgi:hypothetical protein